MTAPTVQRVQNEGPPPLLLALLHEYHDRPGVGGPGRGRFLGRVVIEVWL
jgi:hypothetical protein